MDNPNVLHLRCEAGIDGEPGVDGVYAELPVAREVWEPASEEVREALRTKAREELQSFVYRETGRLLSDDYVRQLPVTAEDPQERIDVPPVTECEVVFLGGPEDGTRMTWKGARPPGIIRLPVKQAPAAALLESLDQPYQGIPIANYSPVTDNFGVCSRADDGAWRYRYIGQR